MSILLSSKGNRLLHPSLYSFLPSFPALSVISSHSVQFLFTAMKSLDSGEFMSVLFTAASPATGHHSSRAYQKVSPK